MKRTINGLFLFVSFVLLLSACRKKEWDEFYGRPENLAPPIYQQLEAKGNFKNFLACIDRAGYKQTLGAGGYWTVFAPDDAAFEKFFQEKGISGVNSIDSLMARKIVTYSIVYNAFSAQELSRYQSPAANTPDNNATPFYAYKRKTAYYDFVYADTVDGKIRKVVAANRNNGSYVSADNGNKHIPYFLADVFAGLNLTAADYNYFYPNIPFNGFNVVNATVTEKDIPAENGIIHTIDKVVLPLNNLDQFLTSNPDYSEFKRLLDMTAVYTYNPDVTHRYQALTHSTDSVFVKTYNSKLAFSPNNENFMASGTDAQINGYSMFVPKNDLLKEYEKKILVNYGSFKAAPPAILYTLLNAHLWTEGIWPSQIALSSNSQQEPITFSAADVINKDSKVASNGFFYGVNGVQDANEFRTVYGKAYLDPKYSLMTMALDAEVKFLIYLPTAKYTLFMMSNDDIRAQGIDYYEDHGAWGYLRPGTTGSIDYNGGKDRVYRLVQTSALATPNGEMDDLSGKGIVEAYNGEYVKFDNGKVYASGNEETNTPVTIDSSKTTVNGKVYYTSGILTFTEKSVVYSISRLAASDPNNYSSYYNLITKSSIYNSDQSLVGVSPGSFYTFFVPTNAAISAAVKAGMLPGDKVTGTLPSSPTAAQKEAFSDFIYYHILDKNVVVPDGKKTGVFPTLYKNDEGDATYLSINNQLNNMVIHDSFNRTANVSIDASNHLSDRTVIHSIDNYLDYNNK